MPALAVFLVFCQALGALVGAVTAVWGELSYMKAMRDGKLDAAERAHLHRIIHGLRYGMTLLLLASLGLTIVAHLSQGAPAPALTPSYWTLIALALVIISIVRALSRQRVSFPLASAIVFAAWWFLVFLSFGWLPLTFGAAVMSFVVAATIFYFILAYARLLAARA